MMYEIRLCRTDERAVLLKFISESWSNSHVFLHDEALLDFQHLDGSLLNFVVAFHQPSKAFHGVLGFISPSFYARGSVAKGDDLWLALWKVEKTLAEGSSLGLDMLTFLETTYSPSSISAIGINNEVALLYRLIGFKTAVMNHWFVPNTRLPAFKIAHFGSVERELGHSTGVGLTICAITFEELSLHLGKAKETSLKICNDYLYSRYEVHPRYRYEYLLVREYGEVVGFAVGRRVVANEVSAFRITDFWLWIDSKRSLREAFVTFLERESLEYVDFLEFGLEKLDLTLLGFIANTDECFVPHLFEPFENSRVDVKIAYRAKGSFSCTKGDSDLDRPNKLSLRTPHD